MRNTGRSTAFVALMTAWGCTPRPSPLAVGPRIDLSTDDVQLRQCAAKVRYPVLQPVAVRNSGSGVLVAPNLSIRYVETAGDWLDSSLRVKGSNGYEIVLTTLDPGDEVLPPATYHADVVLDSPGALNSPTAFSVALGVTWPTMSTIEAPSEIDVAHGRDGWDHRLLLGDPLGCDVPEPALTLSYSGVGGWLEMEEPTHDEIRNQGILTAYDWGVRLRLHTASLAQGEYDAAVDATSDTSVSVPLHLKVQDWGTLPQKQTFTCSLPLQLPDSRVLCAGDRKWFDLATGDWVPGPWTADFEGSVTKAALLDDGHVFLCTSACANTQCSQRVHAWRVYDPSDGSLVASGSLSADPGLVVPLAGSRVLLIGAAWETSAPSAGASVLDTGSGSNSPTGPLHVLHREGGAVRLEGGRVLVAGGDDANAAEQTNADLYNPVTNVWSSTGSMNDARANFAMVLLADGRVLAVGGSGSSSDDVHHQGLPSAEIYDATLGHWTATGTLTAGRSSMSNLLALPDGTVLAAGGLDDAGAALASSERYSPATGHWSAWDNLPAATSGGGAFLVDGSWVFMVSNGFPGWIRRAAYP